MSRPTEISLADWVDQPFRQVPMPGSNGHIDMVPLASIPGHLSLLGRFPAGFVRDVPGGYHASEEFLVLDGELEFDGRVLRRGDLTVVPGHYVRRGMSSPKGCVLLAWFAGAPDFLAPEELAATTAAVEVRNVLGSEQPGLSSDAAVWEISSSERPSGWFEEIDRDLSGWRCNPVTGPAAGALVRRSR